jgi:hypothetical protein
VRSDPGGTHRRYHLIELRLVVGMPEGKSGQVADGKGRLIRVMPSSASAGSAMIFVPFSRAIRR